MLIQCLCVYKITLNCELSVWVCLCSDLQCSTTQVETCLFLLLLFRSSTALSVSVFDLIVKWLLGPDRSWYRSVSSVIDHSHVIWSEVTTMWPDLTSCFICKCQCKIRDSSLVNVLASERGRDNWSELQWNKVSAVWNIEMFPAQMMSVEWAVHANPSQSVSL